MSLVLKAYSSEEHLFLMQTRFFKQLKKYRGKLPPRQKLEYAMAVIGSKYLCEVEGGAKMLLDLQDEIKDDKNKWATSMYFLAVAMARIGNYGKAFEYIRRVLDKYPDDEKTIDLMSAIFERVASKPSPLTNYPDAPPPSYRKYITMISAATICSLALVILFYRR